MSADTPMMRQYRRIKHEHGDAILFFRLGDFYEMFEKDARDVSSILNITLTSRHGIPMCGIPYHAAQSYIGRLLNAGKKIAICEQISLPEGGRGIAEREVVQIITPGTVVDQDFLEKASNNYLVAVGATNDQVSMSFIDLSTGEFRATSFEWDLRGEKLRNELERLDPKELLIQESLLEEDAEISRIVRDRGRMMVNRFPDWDFDEDTSREKLKGLFGVSNLKGFGIEEEREPALLSTAVLLEYVEETSHSLTPHILDIKIYSDSQFLGLDETTQKNLEIVRNLTDGGTKYTLFDVLDFTATAMGTRTLKKWLLNPLTDADHIVARQNSVETLYRNQLLLSSVREKLKGILDLERLAARVALDRAHAKDLLAVLRSLDAFEEVDGLTAEWMSPWTSDEGKRRSVESLRDLLQRAVHEDPSVVLTEGRLIRTGYNEELDRLRDLRDNRQEILASYLEEEKRNSGISNLKIKYNKIIGYYLEVTKANLGHVPEHFVRRQSLVGSERFTTERLGSLESELNNTTERILDRERELFLDVREAVKNEVSLLLEIADHVAGVDCLASFAQAATVRGYSRPHVTGTTRTRITGGRHPVVEANAPAGEFVPNDTAVDSDATSFLLITGPNMAGKSTYLRQVALIVLMAQAGSFVPADEAEIGLVDRIFCRVGASDNLARGESTFLVEMNETAGILRSSTAASLIIMDEVGRGTSTNDGLAIAWAVAEFLLDRGARTLFATHFHELALLEHGKKANLALEVVENDQEVVFLKKVRPGVSDHSYGIHVAQIAGVPQAVVARAHEILERMLAEGGHGGAVGASPSGKTDDTESAPSTDEEPHQERDARPPGTEPEHGPLPEQPPAAAQTPAGGRRSGPQSSLFSAAEIIEREILSLDPNTLTPLDALNRIARWRDELSGRETES